MGTLHKADPLYQFFCSSILPQMGFHGNEPCFNVYMARSSGHVFFYEEVRSGKRLVAKFFADTPGRNFELGRHLMAKEFNSLNYLRKAGFKGYPHYVVRPLGINHEINCVLVEEFCYGTSLDSIILGAITEGKKEALFQKLTSLAYFLATLHNRMAGSWGIQFERECLYFERTLKQLTDRRQLSRQGEMEFLSLKNRWADKTCMWEDREVIVHGDVTPSNFLFGEGLWVIAIDLERMKHSDRVFDLGRLTGELKHFFMQYGGVHADPEPFIGHFLWEYSCHFPDRQSAFKAITRRIPFYMALTLLRIARNSWISSEHREHLIKAAGNTLR